MIISYQRKNINKETEMEKEKQTKFLELRIIVTEKKLTWGFKSTIELTEG